MWHCSVYNKIISDVWRYNNPVYKLITDKLQLVLINVLIKRISIFEQKKIHKVGSELGMRLRCDGILNDQFITQSLLRPTVKKRKIGKSLPKLWTIKYQFVFLMKQGESILKLEWDSAKRIPPPRPLIH